MGNIIPTPPFVIDPLKVYEVKYQNWEADCVTGKIFYLHGTPVARFFGDDIIAWINGGYQGKCGYVFPGFVEFNNVCYLLDFWEV